jgi:prepilin-type N-terminal cleavage/methylation domain-containing protein
MTMRRSDGAFTLLEVMIAVAILALTLTVLLSIVTRNVRATAHSRMTTVATFLARGKMVTMEDKLIEKGFQDVAEEDEGNFTEEGFPEFSWESSIEKIELPTDTSQKVQQAAGDTAQKKDPMQALTGMVGGMMGMFIEPIRVGLEESIRRVTLRVFWNEHRGEQSVELVMYMTDPAKLDIALALGSAGMGGPGGPGAPGSPGGTGRPPTTPKPPGTP